MVNEKVKVMNKYKLFKKIFKILSIIIILISVLIAVYLSGFFAKPKTEFVLENPLKNIIFANTNEAGLVNKEAVIEEGILNFNEEYINYLLIALGVNNLHKSLVGYGDPVIEFVLEQETWNSIVQNSTLNTKIGSIEEEDLIISLSKKEAVEALLSSNIEEFMKNSVKSGNTKIEQSAGKVELGSKGYLAMYKDITGEEIEVK